MSDINKYDSFESAFLKATAKNHLGATYSHIFQEMEKDKGGYASPDFVRTRIQAGINNGQIHVAYGVLNLDGVVESTFSGLESEPELQAGQRVEPVYI